MSKIWSLLILFHAFSNHALSCRPKKNVFIMESRHRKTLFHLFSGPYFTPRRRFFRWKCDTSRKHSEISIMRSSASQSAGWWNPITRWILIITFSQTPLITPEVLISQDFFFYLHLTPLTVRACVWEREFNPSPPSPLFALFSFQTLTTASPIHARTEAPASMRSTPLSAFVCQATVEPRVKKVTVTIRGNWFLFFFFCFSACAH